MRLLLIFALAVSALGFSCRAEARDADLWWTAPGDDGTFGRATSYEIRYKSTPPAATDSVGMAAWVANSGSVTPPAPSTAGVVDSARVVGLDPAKSWFFVVRAIDDSGNAGSWSNVLALTALDVTRPATIGLAGAWR